MSVELAVFIHDSELPTCEDWQKAITEEGLNLHLDSFSFSPREHTGFLPTNLDGEDCGFEYFFGPAEIGDDDSELRAVVVNRDREVHFVFHSSELDCRAAMLAAAVLAKLTNGVYFDPQNGDMATGGEAFELIARQDREERDRRMSLAEKKWGHTTSRRCPTCGAPCPEYKKKCSVCGFLIGLA